MTDYEVVIKKYYKLYNLIDSKLFSSLDKKNNIELNKKYNAKCLGFNLCFADINKILHYRYEHGYAWNKNKPSVKSKLLKIFSFITSLF